MKRFHRLVYKVDKKEQGVLLVVPNKNEILLHWYFPAIINLHYPMTFHPFFLYYIAKLLLP
ncbi:DUF4385 family protein [Sporosarcina sp.]|uniref:DUF4385 family protein n=1 Tax=Sporosarcina sp. TaxID=49982 RepID=UPI00345B9CEA